MKKRFDLAFAGFMVLLLIIAIWSGNAFFKGIILLLFSAALICNTVIRLVNKSEEKFRNKFFFGILLFMEVILELGAVFVIISTFIGA